MKHQLGDIDDKGRRFMGYRVKANDGHSDFELGVVSVELDRRKPMKITTNWYNTGSTFNTRREARIALCSQHELAGRIVPVWRKPGPLVAAVFELLDNPILQHHVRHRFTTILREMGWLK